MSEIAPANIADHKSNGHVDPNEPFVVPRMGRATFRIGDKDMKIDVIAFYDEIVAINQDHLDGKGGEVPFYLDQAKKWGAPPDITMAEVLFIHKHVNELKDELEKKVGPPPSSAGSTESTPLPSNHGSEAS